MIFKKEFMESIVEDTIEKNDIFAEPVDDEVEEGKDCKECDTPVFKEGEDCDEEDIEDDDPTEEEIEDVEEAMLLDDGTSAIYVEGCCDAGSFASEVKDVDNYEDLKEKTFADGGTGDVDSEIEDIIGTDSPVVVPDNVDVLGTSIDDFESKDDDEEYEEDLDDVLS